MNDLPTILLTGFTGILGKRYAYRLAKRGHTVVCPIRAGSEAEARARFEKIFHEMKELLPDFEESVSKNLRPIPGDVREKGLGIPASYLKHLEGPKTKDVWHLAALLDLTETKSQEVYNTNLIGTLNVLEFARQQNIPEFHYFSTFGSSGLIREGVVREIVGIRPPSWRNTYERTKWEAERHVWQAQIRGEISVSIYRPSIIVGDSILGRYEQFNVFNHCFDVVSRVYLKLCEKMGVDPRKGPLDFPMRILGNRNATLNIVPLDFAVDTVMKIYSVPESLGGVYHITNPTPPALDIVEKVFKQNVPWPALSWELFDPRDGFRDAYEKFVAKQMEFLTPYLMGEAIYDYSNVQAALAFHGGIPVVDNEKFLHAIARRGISHGWQDSQEKIVIPGNDGREKLASTFVWPEGIGPVIDFSPHHPIGNHARPAFNYGVTERFLGKAFQVRERFLAKRKGPARKADATGRDIVLVPFGMAVTRRGEAEVQCYEHQHELTAQVFAHMNQVIGFDIRAFGREEIRSHECFGDMHDNCCYAVTDDLVHLIRLFQDLMRTGCTDLISRMQILPHSAGTYLTGWLSGVISFHDMALLTHQCSHLMSENESVISREEVDYWFFNPRAKLSEDDRDLLNQIRKQVDPNLKLTREDLARILHGKLELVFSLNATGLQKLVNDVKEQRIQVTHGIHLSPNSGVFAGNELEMTRFRNLFTGTRKLELKRLTLEVRGTPHYKRFKEAAKHAITLLRLYESQGRLRDPVLPFAAYNGQWVTTREQYIQAVAGVSDQTCYFDRMINRTLDEGGRHYLLFQSGFSSTAATFFEGVIRNKANSRSSDVQIYTPVMRTNDPHPISKLWPQQKSVQIKEPSFSETLRWYESQLLAAHQKAEALPSSAEGMLVKT